MTHERRDSLLRWLPVLVLAGGLIASGSVAQWQIAAHAEELDKREAEIDELVLKLQQLREADIRSEAQLKLEVQSLSSDIEQQSGKLDDLLRDQQQLLLLLRNIPTE